MVSRPRALGPTGQSCHQGKDFWDSDFPNLLRPRLNETKNFKFVETETHGDWIIQWLPRQTLIKTGHKLLRPRLF